MFRKRSYRRRRPVTRRPYRRRRYVRRKPTLTRTGVNLRRSTRGVLPDRLSTKLVYCQVFNHVSSPGTAATNLFSLNGMNDPWLEAGGLPSAGHQPRGFDQLALIYNDYVVTGCKVLFEGSVSTAGGYLVGFGAYAKGAVIPTDPETICELSHYRSMVYNAQRPIKFKKYYNVAQILGTTRSNILDESDYHGLSTGVTNPNYGAGLHMYVRNLDSTQSNLFQCTVQLIYYVTYFNKKPLPAS